MIRFYFLIEFFLYRYLNSKLSLDRHGILQGTTRNYGVLRYLKPKDTKKFKIYFPPLFKYAIYTLYDSKFDSNIDQPTQNFQIDFSSQCVRGFKILTPNSTSASNVV